MRAMKDSGIEWLGEIPADWNKVRFKFLHTGLNTGEAIDKEYWSDEESDITFYTAGLLPIHTTYQDFPEWKYTNENDLLLARNGTPYVYYPTSKACYTDHIIRASIRNDVNRNFVKYCLQQSISSVVVNQVSLATWSASIWDEQVLPWPSNSVQQKIANYLDQRCAEIDALIAAKEKTNELLKEQRQSIIFEAVTKGLNPDVPMKDSGVEWIGEIPEHWKAGKLGYFIEVFNGDRSTNYPSGSDIQDSGVPFLTSSNLEGDILDLQDSKYISEEKYASMSGLKMQLDDIIYCLRGSIGKCSINKTETCGTVASSLMGIRCKDIYPDYLLYVLKSPVVEVQNALFMNGTCAANLSAENVCTYIISIPKMNEQQEIAEHLKNRCNEIDSLICSNETTIQKLKEYRQSIIYEAVTGKMEV